MYNDKKIRRDIGLPLHLRMLYKLRANTSKTSRQMLNKTIRETLNGIKFTIFSNNCLGGVFYHDADRKFTTPTINLAFDGEEFIRFLEKPLFYMIGDFEFIEYDGCHYPVAMKDDIEVRFVHYKSQDECVQKWMERSRRVVWDNVFIVATDHDGMNRPDLMKRFDRLPYKNKIVFTSKEYPEYKWAILVPQFKGRHQVRVMTNYGNLRGQRYYEMCFDIAKWIKQNSPPPKCGGIT